MVARKERPERQEVPLDTPAALWVGGSPPVWGGRWEDGSKTEGRCKEDARKTLNPPLTKACEAEDMKALIPLLFLAACASPAVEFMNATRTDTTVNGRNYTVFQKGERVEVIRLGYARRGEHQEIRATMIELIPVVTGCKLRENTLQGDSGEMRGSLDCPA
jgi:hypothetical protein